MPVQLIPFDYQDVGRQIRLRRNKLGLTQRQLADKVPCSLTYISRIENGAKPSLEVLVRIAHILDLSLDTLFCVQATDDTELLQILRMISHQSPEVRHVALSMLKAYIKSQQSLSAYNAEKDSEPISLLADAPEDWH